VAYAVPRNAPSPDVEIILPQPLAPSDVVLYQRIISLQDEGAYRAADVAMQRLGDPILTGAILSARYTSPDYRASTAELESWYSRYAGEPTAPAIYRLLARRLPRADWPAAPRLTLLPELTYTAGSMGHPIAAADGYAWHARFMAGITDWISGNLAASAAAFDASAKLNGISDDERAASDFWAARAALRQMDPDAYLDWLHQAASSSDSFYGMIAGRLLGQGFGPTGIAATLTEADITAVDATDEGHLAFALLQVGKTDQAELALRALWPQMRENPDLGRAVLAVASRAGLVDVTLSLAGRLPSPLDEIAGARLPLPALHPIGGFTVDPALVYALTRTESGFNPAAVSPVGARGLMQLMPVTADYMRREAGIAGGLGSPSANLALGQAYLRYLGEQPGINDNLLAILASYNAGPAAAAAWYGMIQDQSDPLLFIETIPNSQTRRFVRQVLADSWLYAEEIGIKPKSLDDMAEGNFPKLDLNYSTAASN
jgi:soluble lytic murein transglycosylase-like protein